MPKLCMAMDDHWVAHTKLLSVMWIQNPRWSPLQYKVLTFDPMGK